MTFQTDPLEQLLVDQTEVDRAALAQVLAPLVRIDRVSGRYSFLPGVSTALDGRRMVIAALLARKALSLLNAEFVEACPPRVLEREIGIPGGTLRPLLRGLSQERIVARETGNYYVANHSLVNAINEVHSNE
jgi:hypothetical protein